MCTWRRSQVAAPGKQSGTRLGRQHTAPVPACEAIDMAARRCPTRRKKTILHPRPRQPVHLRPARRPPGRLRHSPSKREGPRCAGRVPGRKSADATLKNERANADGASHKKQGRPGHCFPDRVGIQSEPAPIRPGAQDNRTSSLKHSFQGYPRHARQSKFRNSTFSATKRDVGTPANEQHFSIVRVKLRDTPKAQAHQDNKETA